MMAERNVDVVHTTIMRWVQRYVPEFDKRWQRFTRSVGTSWRIDETYSKIRGKWGYLYRGVDKDGQTIDVFLSARRDIAAAQRFLQQAIEKRGRPQKITLDGYAASHEAVAELQAEGVLPPTLTVRTNRYLKNVIEQDHRRIKQRMRPLLGFKRFAHAAITLSGIE
jgi:transposase-like protein